MMFTTAIVRKPCPEMVHGITSVSLGKPDLELALIQHAAYVDALQDCGLEVILLEPDNRFPDSTFVEDVALVTPEFAVITNPGASSRNGEKLEIKEALSPLFEHVESITEKGTLDAGDVMMAGSHFYIGLSGRTNHEGADQLIRILEKYQRTGEKVEFKEMLHLKSGVSFLEQETLLASEAIIDHEAFKKYRRIGVVPGEEYAANSLWINGNVLVPDGFPQTRDSIEKAGYTTLSLDVSEFRKLDGGLSCLSLRF
jgi:dimethylargininase